MPRPTADVDLQLNSRSKELGSISFTISTSSSRSSVSSLRSVKGRLLGPYPSNDSRIKGDEGREEVELGSLEEWLQTLVDGVAGELSDMSETVDDCES